MARFIVELYDSQIAETVKTLVPAMPGNIRLIDGSHHPGSTRFNVEATEAEAAELQSILNGIGSVERDELLPPPGMPFQYPRF